MMKNTEQKTKEETLNLITPMLDSENLSDRIRGLNVALQSNVDSILIDLLGGEKEFKDVFRNGKANLPEWKNTFKPVPLYKIFFEIRGWAYSATLRKLGVFDELSEIDLGEFGEVNDLSVLEDLPNLKSLTVRILSDTDITSLKEIPNLEYLTLWIYDHDKGEQEFDLSPLAALLKLKKVNIKWIRSNSIYDVNSEVLSALDFTPLSSLKNLKSLTLEGVDRVVALDSVSELEIVHLDKIQNLVANHECGPNFNLRELRLYECNLIKDLKELTQCFPRIECLKLLRCKSLKNIRDISKWNNLIHLEIIPTKNPEKYKLFDIINLSALEYFWINGSHIFCNDPDAQKYKSEASNFKKRPVVDKQRELLNDLKKKKRLTKHEKQIVSNATDGGRFAVLA